MIGPDQFGSTPIRSPGAHARPFDETDRQLEAVLDRVPITRVYEMTTLDTLGLPVWGAVTPLARDLTVHAGKGATAQAARISAVMEAIERVCAEDVDGARVLSATFNELRSRAEDAVIDPAAFDLPFQSTYAPGHTLAWIEGYDLLAQRHVWVPLDVVISPAREGVCAGVETNGLAAGNTYTEAVLHALYEVIERDAAAHERFATLYAEPSSARARWMIDPSSLPARAAAQILELRERGVRTTVRCLTHDLGVSVYQATMSDRAFPGREGQLWRFDGLGCDLDGERTLSRAISEAAQSHTALLVGARDAFEDTQRHARRTAAGLVQQLLTPSAFEPFEDQRAGTDDLHCRMLMVLERLQRAGLSRVVVVDLTAPEIEIPVVRVLVPGAAWPYGDSARRPALRLLRSLL